VPLLHDDPRPRLVTGAFTALVIDQMPQVLCLPTVPYRRAEHTMGNLQVDHDKSAGAPD
jgi:hypothetical protein